MTFHDDVDIIFGFTDLDQPTINTAPILPIVDDPLSDYREAGSSADALIRDLWQEELLESVIGDNREGLARSLAADRNPTGPPIPTRPPVLPTTPWKPTPPKNPFRNAAKEIVDDISAKVNLFAKMCNKSDPALDRLTNGLERLRMEIA